jgi:hypothetical protein
MPAEYLPSFTQAPVLNRCTADTHLAKMRWDVGHGWCLGIYLERHAGCLEVETSWGLRKHGLANLMLEPF